MSKLNELLNYFNDRLNESGKTTKAIVVDKDKLLDLLVEIDLLKGFRGGQFPGPPR
jgi:hypothetical protein